MTSDVDAVMAALRLVLAEAERRTNQHLWQVSTVDRWVDQLPGGWTGRWHRLRLRPETYTTTASREDLITHVRATLAYIETNREAIAAAKRSWWPFRTPRETPIDAEFKEVADVPKPTGRAVRLVKKNRE